MIRKKKLCRVPGCRRPSRALGVCQTHYKHLKKFGEARAIKPRRRGRPGTVKFAGFSLTPDCVRELREAARRERRAVSALMTDVVERWARRR